MKKRCELLILGVGNTLCTDDGAGPAAVHLLNERYVVDDRIEVVDGGTLGLSLLPMVEDADRLIIVDAITIDGPPGTLVRLSGDDVLPAARLRLSPHQVGVGDLLDAARLLDKLPSTLRLIGIVPQSIELGTELSPAVEAQMDALVQMIAEEVRTLGFTMSRHGAPASCRQARGHPALAKPSATEMPPRLPAGKPALHPEGSAS